MGKFVALSGWFAFLMTSLIASRCSLREVKSLLYESKSSIIYQSTQMKEHHHMLPDWYLTTECSPYSIDCVSREIRKGKYSAYPFPLLTSGNFNAFLSRDGGVWKDANTFPKRSNDRDPEEESHASNAKAASTTSPGKSSECVKRAQTASMKEQLDYLLPPKEEFWESSNRRIAFSITDYSYSKDMLDDIFAMAHDIMHLDHYFLAALDEETIKMACGRGHPVLGFVYGESHEDDEEKDEKEEEGWVYNYKTKKKVVNVAMSKWKVALEILERQYPVFFFEMDVWFLRPPEPLFRDQTADAMFSGHADNPEAINIGVYSVLPTQRSIDFFRASISLFEQRPTVHDQFVMQQILKWSVKPPGAELEYDKQWGKNVWGESPPPIPKFEDGFITHETFPSWSIVSDVRPMLSDKTYAIHVLAGVPLSAPHGKQQVAKEMGAWMGSNGYYDSIEAKYLWMDGHIHNAVAMTMTYPGRDPHYQYHNFDTLKWVVSCTIALANYTNRIWVAPKVVYDRGIDLLWTKLDMQSVEEFIQIRETSFPSNPRTWLSSRRYDPVSRIAISGEGGQNSKIQLYRQRDAWPTRMHNGTTGVEAWNLDFTTVEDAMDKWFALSESAHASRVLLAGLPAVQGLLNKLKDIDGRKAKKKAELNRTIPAEDIVHVYRSLKWCVKSHSSNDKAAPSLAGASNDCYGKGS